MSRLTSPNDFGAAVIASASGLIKSARQRNIVSVVGGRTIVWTDEAVAPRVHFVRVRVTPMVKAIPGYRRSATKATQTTPIRKSASTPTQRHRRAPSAPVQAHPATYTTSEPQLMMKSFSALDRMAQLTEELKQRIANPGAFL